MAELPRSLVRRRRIRPTLRGLVVALAGVAAIVVGLQAHLPEFVPFGVGAILLVALGAALVALRPPRLDVRRATHPSPAVAGRPLRVQLVIRNRARRPSPGLRWNDALPWRIAAEPRELAPLPGGPGRVAETAVEYVVTPPRRGHFPLGPLVVEYGDPFGMVRAVTAIGEAERVVVVPAVAAVGEGGPSLDQGDGLAQLTLHRATDNEDDLTTREYRPGDALRRVHWRVTARQGELMVRQEEARSDPDARLLLDTREAGYRDLEPDRFETWEPTAHSESFEWVVRMAASLAAHLDDQGFRVTIEETGSPQLPAGRGARERGLVSGAFLRALAGLRLLPGGLERAAVGDPPRGPLFALLGEPRSETVEWLISRRDRRDTGVAFLAGASEVAARRLQAAGWAVVRVGWADQNPAQAWREAEAAVRRMHERP